MPSDGSLVAFVVLSGAVVLAPGPSVMFVVSRAVALGRRVALLTVLGNGGGLLVQVLLVTVGLGAILERSLALFTLVKLAGAAYLVWLGIQAIRHRRTLGHDGAAGQVAPTRSVLAEGFVVGLTNPKSLAVLTAILPQFVVSGGLPVGVQMALLGLLFVLIAVVGDSVWGVAAGTARRWFANSPRRAGWLGAGGGAVMVLLGAQLALSGHGD